MPKTKGNPHRIVDGVAYVRVTAWVRQEMAVKFKEVVKRRQVESSDVLRSSMASYIANDREERDPERSGKPSQRLARRIFRNLIGVLTVREILQTVLRTMPRQEIETIVTDILKETDR